LLAGPLALCGNHPAPPRPLVSAADRTGTWRGTYTRSETVTAVFHYFAVRETQEFRPEIFDMTAWRDRKAIIELLPKALDHAAATSWSDWMATITKPPATTPDTSTRRDAAASSCGGT
jgi:hypothetical protein